MRKSSASGVAGREMSRIVLCWFCAFVLLVILVKQHVDMWTLRRIVTHSLRHAHDRPVCCTKLEQFVGPLHAQIKHLQSAQVTEREVAVVHSDVSKGGHWSPAECVAQSRIVIIVSYRDRAEHIYKLLAHLIPILKRQKLDFRFVLAEQNGTALFNKGRLYNTAYQYSRQFMPDCVVFQDVDVLPEDDRNSYACTPLPSQLGGRVNTLNYEVWNEYGTGGALSVRPEQFERINGYSNNYWGWGKEDDDLGKRFWLYDIKVIRPDAAVGRNTMLEHKHRRSEQSPLTMKIYDEVKTLMKTDGLNSLNTVLVEKTIRPLFHHLMIDVGEMDERWRQATVNLTKENTAERIEVLKRMALANGASKEAVATVYGPTT